MKQRICNACKSWMATSNLLAAQRTTELMWLNCNDMGHSGAVVGFLTCNWRVLGSNLSLALHCNIAKVIQPQLSARKGKGKPKTHPQEKGKWTLLGLRTRRHPAFLGVSTVATRNVCLYRGPRTSPLPLSVTEGVCDQTKTISLQRNI